jgi:hypothetical protein
MDEKEIIAKKYQIAVDYLKSLIYVPNGGCFILRVIGLLCDNQATIIVESKGGRDYMVYINADSITVMTQLMQEDNCINMKQARKECGIIQELINQKINENND